MKNTTDIIFLAITMLIGGKLYYYNLIGVLDEIEWTDKRYGHQN